MTRLEELLARRQRYLDSETKILKSQEYQIGSAGHARRNRMADLEQIRKEIRLLDAEILPLQQAAAGVRRVRYLRTC